MQTASPYSVPELPLRGLDLAGLSPVRQVLRRYGAQDHSRWIFRGLLAPFDEPVFVKIWNPGYVRARTLPVALAAGFYDAANVPALRGLVMSEGVCRGYVMAACSHRIRMGPRFYDLICRRTQQTGFFAVQFSPSHTLRIRGLLSMIDLEGVYPVDRLDLVATHHSAFAHAPYAAFVAACAQAPLPPLEPRRSLAKRARAFVRARLISPQPNQRCRRDLIAR
ncbi:hypothetical protein KUV62_17375 [Salipiger bermudensis]|uniref:hypothetical protein n=1 Tax=Salipiger bermudensis TaxID=344736 RepID=UPI001C9A1810|nr:hypothetical protein [Salipiger bermudensis]MBY6005696.1 hypothetical protein [Salipiger bermudensis]